MAANQRGKKEVIDDIFFERRTVFSTRRVLVGGTYVADPDTPDTPDKVRSFAFPVDLPPPPQQQLLPPPLQQQQLPPPPSSPLHPVHPNRSETHPDPDAAVSRDEEMGNSGPRESTKKSVSSDSSGDESSESCVMDFKRKKPSNKIFDVNNNSDYTHEGLKDILIRKGKLNDNLSFSPTESDPFSAKSDPNFQITIQNPPEPEIQNPVQPEPQPVPHPSVSSPFTDWEPIEIVDKIPPPPPNKKSRQLPRNEVPFPPPPRSNPRSADSSVRFGGNVDSVPSRDYNPNFDENKLQSIFGRLKIAREQYFIEILDNILVGVSIQKFQQSLHN